MRLEGLHHITAITADARRNVDFYARVLGLRLVKKTVNFDQPDVYHLYFGDERGTPGSILTFFEFPDAAKGRAGDGTIHTIQWRLGSAESLGFWERRLQGEGVAAEREGDELLRFADPEGLTHELLAVAVDDAPLAAQAPGIPAEHALQGFEGVRAYTAHADGSAVVLEKLMNATRSADDTFELRGDRRSGWIRFDAPPEERGRPSAGTVHHVAWGTTDDELPAWIDLLNEVQIPNSGYVDRHYFHSLYFREPGGILYELATAEPGFTVDGPEEELGRTLILPPFLEHRRAEIEARLTPIPDPRADRPVTAP
jgi:glyoxalase family protein